MSNRIAKVNDFIRDNLSIIINKKLSLKKGLFATITKVDTSPDMQYTKVSISVFPNKETNYVFKTLKKEIYQIQKLFNRKFSAKRFPRISFLIDEKGEKVTQMEKIFEQIRKESYEK